MAEEITRKVCGGTAAGQGMPSKCQSQVAPAQAAPWAGKGVQAWLKAPAPGCQQLLGPGTLRSRTTRLTVDTARLSEEVPLMAARLL